MQVVWDGRFREDYSGDPASREGRLEPVLEALEGEVAWVAPTPATPGQLLRAHAGHHLEWVRLQGVYDVAALAAGGAVRAGQLGLAQPAFALVRPPGHHASVASAWGFCYFNNLAVALLELHAREQIRSALVVDFDLHVGDGTVDILGKAPWVRIVNPGAPDRDSYLTQVVNAVEAFQGDCIAVSAGFDNHLLDWGGLLHTEDYGHLGARTGLRARTLGACCFGVLEGGYNHAVLGQSVRAFLGGLETGWQGGAGP